MKKNEKVLALCNLLMYRERIVKDTDTISLKLIRQIGYLMNGNPNFCELIIFTSNLEELEAEIIEEAKKLGFHEQFAKEIAGCTPKEQ